MADKSGPMAPKTKTKSLNGIYDKYKDSEYWKIIEDAIDNLEENKDIILQTHTDIVIGYIIKQLEKYEQKSKGKESSTET